MKQSDDSGWRISFFVVWVGQSFSLFGRGLVQFALIWWMTSTTGSATVLATASIMNTIPAALLNPVAGALVDRWNRRLVIMANHVVNALVTVVLVALYAMDAAQVWHIYILVFLRAIGRIFHNAAMLASTTMMVPEEHYSRVNGLNQALQGTMTILTPLLGALLFEVLSMQRILSIDVGMSLVAIAPLLFFTIPQPVLEESTEVGGDSPSLLDDLKEGLRLVIGWPGIMMLMLVFGLVHLVFTPSMSLLPILVTDHFKGGALELAWLQSAMGVGVVTGGLILGVWGGFKRRIVTTILGLALAGVSMAVVGLTPANAFTLAAMGMFSVGLTVSFVVAARQAIIQVVVPPEMQGRVYTLVTSGWAVMDPVGLAIGGPLAEEFGVRILYVACSVVMVTLGVGAFFVPAIMQIENKTPATSRTL